MALLGSPRGSDSRSEPRYATLGEDTAQAVRRAAQLLSGTAEPHEADIDDIEVRRSVAEHDRATRSSPAALRVIHVATLVLALAVLALGLTAAVGHATRDPGPIQLWLSGMAPVRWWPAVSFVLLGTATAALAWRPHRVTTFAALAIGALTATLAATVLGEHVSGLDLIADNPFLPPTADHADRMLAVIALAVLALGLATALQAGGRHIAAQWATTVPISIGYLAVLAWAFGVSDAYRVVLLAVVSPLTALGILACGVALLVIHPDRGFARTLADTTAGGRLTRRLLPVVLIAPCVLGWVAQRVVRSGQVDAPFALALVVTAVCLIGAAAVLGEAYALRRLDIRRVGTAAVLEQVRAAEAAQARLAQELTETERRTRAVLESALDAIVELDSGGVITSWNPAAERLYGWPADHAVGERFDTLLTAYHEGHAVPIRVEAEYLDAAVDRGPADYVVVARDGTPLEIESRYWVWKEAGASAYTQLSRDASARRQAQRDLLDLNKQLDEFAALTAHDLRGPLTTVRGYLEMLEDLMTEQGDERALELIRRMDHASQRGSQLIDDLLAYSRASRGTFEAAPVDLGRLAQSVAQDVRARVERPCDIEVAEIAPVLGEEGALRQVMANLLYNAVHYCPPDRTPRVVVASEATNTAHAVLTVTDNGPGIPREERVRIFEMFQRGSTGSGRSGTGVGLALCRRVVERHGGDIWVEDAPGGGSRFGLTLPRHHAGATS